MAIGNFCLCEERHEYLQIGKSVQSRKNKMADSWELTFRAAILVLIATIPVVIDVVVDGVV